MNLNETIALIDTKIAAKLTPSNLLPFHAYGLASRYYEEDIFYTGIMDNNGEITNCMLEDKYNVSWYQRNQRGAYAVVESNYGNKQDKVEEINEINFIIFANTKKIKISLEKLKDIFVSAIPSVLSKVECESLNILGCEISLTAHELDSQVVIKEETNKDKVRVGLEHGCIAIRYQIKSTYRRGCTVICECPN